MEQLKEFMRLLDDVVEDGELSYQEICQVAKWINEHKEARQQWPVSEFIKPLQTAFSDGKIDKREASEVGLLIQRVRREWARKATPQVPTESLLGSVLQNLKRKANELGQSLQRPQKTEVVVAQTVESVVASAIEKFSLNRAALPSIPIKIRVPSESESDSEYLVDLSSPSCSCPDFKANRKSLPNNHLSRCCKHVLFAFSQVEPDEGWPGWLDAFFELAMRPYPNQDWGVVALGSYHAIFSSASKDWANVYLKSDSKNMRYGYNVNEDRWSYGTEPPNSAAIANAIRKLSN